MGAARAKHVACMYCGVWNAGCIGGDAYGKPMPSGIAATVVNSCMGLGDSAWSGGRFAAFAGVAI